MQKTLFIKLSIIAGLCLLFVVGLNLIQQLVYERQQYADTVIAEIASQHVNAQEVLTPFIAVPTTITPACKTTDQKNCQKPFDVMTPKLANSTQAKQDFAVSTDTYKRGIYHATSYQGQLNFDQQYKLIDQSIPSATSPKSNGLVAPTTTDETPAPSANNSAVNQTSISSTNAFAAAQTVSTITRDESIHYNWDAARLIIPVSDLRGVAQLPTVKVNGTVMTANYPETPMMAGLNYVEVILPAALIKQSALKVSVELPLMGLSAVRTIPLGQQFSLSVNGDWHAPNFIGQALPAHKSFDNQGFQASWQNQYLTVANNQLLSQCLIQARGNCDIRSRMSASESADMDYDISRAQAAVQAATTDDSGNVINSNIISDVQLNGFGISFAEPNDVYLQTERTLKYALLLILVSFGTFFLFEIIKSLKIHPIQYLLVGSALLVFYVLLLPLAEQIVFWQAYLIASIACVGLIGWYTFYVLGSFKRAGVFTLILGGLYAGFYGILTTEDMNLLLGAIFCFVLLASVMYFTRKIDWYQVA